MNVNNISVATAPVETMSAETVVPVSLPDKVDSLEKAKSQMPKDNHQAATAKEGQESSLSNDEKKELVAELNEIMDDLQTNLGFSIREDLGHTVIVEIKNQETNELIKQIPSEELLTIKEKMLELTGLMLDQSV